MIYRESTKKWTDYLELGTPIIKTPPPDIPSYLISKTSYHKDLLFHNFQRLTLAFEVSIVLGFFSMLYLSLWTYVTWQSATRRVRRMHNARTFIRQVWYKIFATETGHLMTDALQTWTTHELPLLLPLSSQRVPTMSCFKWTINPRKRSFLQV